MAVKPRTIEALRFIYQTLKVAGKPRAAPVLWQGEALPSRLAVVPTCAAHGRREVSLCGPELTILRQKIVNMFNREWLQ